MVLSDMHAAAEILDALLSMADPRHAKAMQRFFKTGPGEYGEGDRFIGVKNPQVRLVVKEAWRSTTLAQAAKLAQSPLHEARLCALLIMVEKYLYAMKTQRRAAAYSHESCDEIYETYLSLHPYVNNWDLVDLSAIKIVGYHEAGIRSNLQALGAGRPAPLTDEWIKPGHTLWQQRIAMVSTWMLIHKDMPEIAFERAVYLLDNPHDLLHKAAGWMLREAWKQGYKEELRDFLQKHVKSMPSIMLSYACEQMPNDERHYWQQQRRMP